MITSLFLNKDNIKDYLSSKIELFFGIDGYPSYEKHLNPIIDTLSDNIVFFFEYPYIEKYYRDSYYSFHSKKHKAYNRNSIRISFFDKSISSDDFFKSERQLAIQDNFHGYITIRPTTYNMVGHSFISPKALKKNNFVSCLNTESVMISGHKLKVTGFPFISQDNESITCSESTIITLLDYFSHKYPGYSFLLPSEISRILSKHSSERQLPTKGLPTQNISFVLKKMGFGTVVYSYDAKSKYVYNKSKFKEIMFAYIESGIPIIATLSSKKNNHAVLIIGRKNITQDIKILNSRT